MERRRHYFADAGNDQLRVDLLSKPFESLEDLKNLSTQTHSIDENNSQAFPVGVVVGAHALAGCLKVRPSSNNPDLLLDIKTVFIETGTEKPLPYAVDSIYFERRLLFLKVKNVSDRTQAERLIGSTVTTVKSQVRNLSEDEWWVTDLVGLAVYTTDGASVGTVYDIVGENSQLLEIKRHSGESLENILVPFVRALVPVVDIANKRIEVVNVPGLLE